MSITKHYAESGEEEHEKNKWMERWAHNFSSALQAVSATMHSQCYAQRSDDPMERNGMELKSTNFKKISCYALWVHVNQRKIARFTFLFGWVAVSKTHLHFQHAWTCYYPGISNHFEFFLEQKHPSTVHMPILKRIASKNEDMNGKYFLMSQTKTYWTIKITIHEQELVNRIKRE